jgi:hypothetical protein
VETNPTFHDPIVQGDVAESPLRRLAWRSPALTDKALSPSLREVSAKLLLVGSLAANFGLILIVFKVMTAVKFTWRDVVLGVVLATVFWQTLQLVGTGT